MHVKAKVVEEEPLEHAARWTTPTSSPHPYTPRAPLERLLRHNIPETSDTRIVVHLHPSWPAHDPRSSHVLRILAAMTLS